MTKRGTTRHGSLQFYPRVRAKRTIPRVSWKALSDKKNEGLLGFIGYKVGMKSAYVKDNCGSSLTKGQRVTIPVTVIECPTMKIFSVRFYKDNIVMGEVLNSGIDKEMKKNVKVPKIVKIKVDDFVSKNEGKFEDIRVVLYSQVKKTGIKKKPDVAEIGLTGDLDGKLNFVKENMNKEISITDFLSAEVMKEGLIDMRGVTKGKGLQGPMKRFGLTLRHHKSEKGRRGPGSGGPWHPARVEYTQPMAGQMGYFTRVVYNNKIIRVSGEDINPKQGFKKYGTVRGDYIVVFGSVQGPVKRQLLITVPLRASKDQIKRNYEFLELR